MLISAREASRVFDEVALIGRQQSRRALLAGLAGEGLRAGGTLLYDEQRVHDLADWPDADHQELLAACPGGVFVSRLGRGQEPDPAASWAQRAEALRRQPDVGLMARVQVRVRIEDHGPLPFVATVCGFPVLMADLVGISPAPHHQGHERQVELDLAPPGPWRALLDRQRLVTSPGPPWLLLGAQPYLGRAERARSLGLPVGSGRSTTWSRWA